jgi:hypothetical protein
MCPNHPEQYLVSNGICLLAQFCYVQVFFIAGWVGGGYVHVVEPSQWSRLSWYCIHLWLTLLWTVK